MKRKLPAFKTDEEAARFLDRKDLSDYINVENMVPAHFEFERKTKSLTMRIPAALLEAVKARAARQGIPYQRFIRQTLERETRDGEDLVDAFQDRAGHPGQSGVWRVHNEIAAPHAINKQGWNSSIDDG